MEAYLVMIFCLINNPNTCQKVYSDEVFTSTTQCAMVSQQLAASWLSEHSSYEIGQLRCTAGWKPTPRDDPIF